MPVQELDPTISRPSWDIAGTVQPNQRATSNGLSSIPSQLQNSVRESAHEFYIDDCIGSFSNCISSFFKGCLTFLKSLFSCFFSSEEAPVQENAEPLSEAQLADRSAAVKHHVKNLLQVRADTPAQAHPLKAGLSPDVLNGGKVAVLLKYNKQLAFCSKQLNGTSSLEELINETNRAAEEFVRHRDNERAQTAVFSITAIAMNKFTTVVYNGRRTAVMGNMQRQTYHINPPDFRESEQCKRENFITKVQRYTTTTGIHPARASLIEGALDRFFYNSNH